MTDLTSTQLSLDRFLDQYGNNPRYELIDGELRDMEPTGPHETVAGNLSGYVFNEIQRSLQPWIIPKNCLIQPPASEATALRPDVIVLDETKLDSEPLWQQEPIICNGDSIQWVAEVVSTNWQDDYARKVEEYALLGIPEYWIVDYRGLGGLAFIGKPKQPTLTVCWLDETTSDEYQQQQYRLGETIRSPQFPQLHLRLDDLLPRSL
jgi:Uma2 family endonuclease